MSAEEIIKIINTAREQPKTQKKKLETVGKALERAKRRHSGLQLESFAQELEEKKALKPLKVSPGLMAAASKKIVELIANNEIKYEYSDEEIAAIIQPHVKSFTDVVVIVDHGDLEHFLSRAMISDHDPKRLVRAAIFSEYNNFIGAATRKFEEDDLTVVFIAEKIKEQEKDYGEFSELKQIFDLLDSEGEGVVNPTEVLAAFRVLKFDHRNPNLFSIFEELERDFLREQRRIERENEDIEKKRAEGKEVDREPSEPPKGVEFESFRDNVVSRYVKVRRTRKQLRGIFNLFIDDAEDQTISTVQLKRITAHLDEEISPEELKRLMNWSTMNGSEMNFDEFYDVMTINPL